MNSAVGIFVPSTHDNKIAGGGRPNAFKAEPAHASILVNIENSLGEQGLSNNQKS